ncbi:hypothetical protein HanHA300_Chr04g0126681 [Helianthus annuus]|nr:hypothetical protein HanHA300_Chr04g0126681 [Helianthus annuus]KAJ0587684.1 hypothetical protein HanIR_Chr04g0165991 [Helianthus annuus]KAJ0596161.1 hypothetical protein HanHA89_Chr04g0139591 [Helianthus annuus]KAJ0756812.1 hypothetical protein HanLR1_Chr04g0131331 [Helianthus annuus]KAJ0760555.1 hypothetical protein HanOQP8_Chr04g0139301 [Helianthus annuus]
MNSAYPLIHHVLCFNLTWCDNLIGVFWAGDTCHPILFSVFFTNLPSHTFLIEGRVYIRERERPGERRGKDRRRCRRDWPPPHLFSVSLFYIRERERPGESEGEDRRRCRRISILCRRDWPPPHLFSVYTSPWLLLIALFGRSSPWFLLITYYLNWF